MSLDFKQLNPHACRSYLVGREGADEVVLIDPVLDHLDDYRELLDRKGLTLTRVLDTHTHADHISGAAALKDMLDCPYVMHEAAPAHCAETRVADGDTLELLGEEVRILHTPGHTKDSISLVFPQWVFTGDALFLDDGGAGRDDLPGGDPGEHWESLRKLERLPEELLVLPAHDYRARQPSSLGRQKTTNPHLKPRTRQEFVRYLEDLRLGPADWMKDVLKANYACARDPKAAWIPLDAPACEVKGTLGAGVNEIEVATITVRELKARLKGPREAGEKPLLLDVREEHELHGELGHLDGIVHIPIGHLAHRLEEVETLGEREIVTVCRSGARAHTAAQILRQAGFPRVSVLEGGMIAWKLQWP
ncbi:MAG: MBL fold metallo-hydrolase [Spirochaetales bacterium]|nr:MBL fold metallo-hydrolase [Spirochaetales bacterium]